MRISRYIGAGMVCMLTASPALAQHEQGHAARRDTTQAGRHETDGRLGVSMEGMDEMAAPETAMPGTLLPDIPMQQESSGTSWQPEASPMEAIHVPAGGWEVMFHGNAFLRLNSQDVFGSGTRGDTQVDVPNWFMAMASRPLGTASVLGLRAMMSLDAAIAGERGYPLLFQSGETFGGGQPLIDRQHPHDLFSELAVSFGQRLSDKAGVFAYFGLPGEPTIGPPAFMHRPSAMHLPDSPIGHHWQDATHIVFGVATFGARYGIFKLDGSVFTGREPNEARFDIDRPRFDSYSLRLSANPNDRWALQVSRGFLKSPETLEPDEDVWRTTASAMYNTPFGRSGAWSNAFVWGLNQSAGDPDEGHGALHSFLLESDLDFGRSAVYTRLELTQKDTHELGLEPDIIIGGPPLQFEEGDKFNIGTWSLGAARDIVRFGDLKLMLGAHGTLYRVPSDLKPIYGDFPVSAQVYLRLSPARMRMDHGGMQHDDRTGDDQQDGMQGMHHDGHQAGQMPGMQQDQPMDSTAAMGQPMMDMEMHRAMEFIVRLLSDPEVEARIHSDPQLQQLWEDPKVQEHLQMMRQMHGLDGAGHDGHGAQPVPKRPAGTQHQQHEQRQLRGEPHRH